MILYRLEHKESGLGPWGHASEKSWNHMDLVNREQDRMLMPTPLEDGLGSHGSWVDPYNHCFGFTSQKNMLDYFSLDFLVNMIVDFGFVIRELEVSECEVGRGGFQARFHRESIVCSQIILEGK